MRAVLLIALNFLREQRWIVLVLMGWLVVGAAVVAYGVEGRYMHEDVLFYVRQQAAYALALAVLLTSSGIQNDRRSRRILAVLAKGIRRSQYIAGVLAGVALALGIYCVVFGLALSWLAPQAHLPKERVPELMMVVFGGAMFAAALTMVFATFMHPLLATGSTALLMGSPLLVKTYFGTDISWWMAGYRVALDVAAFTFSGVWEPDWAAWLAALAQAGVFWAVASWIFSYRDVTVAIE